MYEAFALRLYLRSHLNLNYDRVALKSYHIPTKSEIGGQRWGEKGGSRRRDAPALAQPLKAPSIVMVFAGYIADGFSDIIEAL